MTSTVEPCESNGPSISSTLEMFDTFKSCLKEDDKDSDEESFHLPMLGCDDDNDSYNKEISSPGAENEDEILDKFDNTTATPDIDPNMEESILKDDDEVISTNKHKTDSDKLSEKATENGVDEKHDEADEQFNESTSKEDKFKHLEIVDELEEVDMPKNSETKDCQDITVPESEDKHHKNTEETKTSRTTEESTPETDEEKAVDTITNNKKRPKRDKTDSKSNKKAGIDDQRENSSDTSELKDISSENASTVEEGNPDDETAMEIDSVNVADNQTISEKTTSGVLAKNNGESVSKLLEGEEQLSSKKNSTSENLNCDDLLDVSVIKDLEEDDADAIEDNTAQSSEKSDNDDQEDDKAENEIDSSELDQEENVNSSDKEERVDSEDGNSNMCDQEISTNDDLTSDVVGDNGSKSNDDVTMTETETVETTEDRILDKNEESVQSNQSENDKQEGLIESVVSHGKRPLSDKEDGEIVSKKFRLSSDANENQSREDAATENMKKASTKGSNIETLISFESFMQSKKFSNTKLTRSDLEQFCLQKICEAIMHMTDTGELNQTIKKQEHIIENLRKDLSQLSKQARDLDIVNKKLMSELKLQNGTKKPLVPLKITRSVGLQVKLNIGGDQTARRKQSSANPPKTPSTPMNNASMVRNRNIASNANVVRQVHQVSTTPTMTTPIAPATSQHKTAPSTPILSQALQNRQTSVTAKRPPIRPKTPAETPKPAQPGVIDLTDEDDRAAKNMQQIKSAQGKTPLGTSIKILNKNVPVVQQRTVNLAQNKAGNKMLQSNVSQQVKAGTRTVTTIPQGVRLTPTQLKNGLTLPAGVVTSSSSGTPQLMYVVQPSSLVTSTAGGPQKTVLLNFQPTSQVLTSTINGSTVSMLPSKANTVQLKTIVTRKHPAPLPLPSPAVAISSLKPLLPKPHLSIRKTDTGIILQWRMPYNLDLYEGIASYQLFAYQETNALPSTDMWRKVGDVKALALPMACTLTQFADKNKYYFAVRSVDVHKRIGAFSDPEEISL